MLVQEILKIVRRRGMYWTFIGVMLASAAAVLVIAAIVRATQDPGQELLRHEIVEAGREVLSFVAFVMAALIGAQEGAYDTQQGTFRYLVMTGRSKLGLYLVRYPALAVALIAGLLPSMVLVAAGSMAFATGGVTVTTTDWALLVWQPVLWALVYGAIALAVGALLRSVGGAIVVALVLNLAGFNLLALLTLANDSLDRVVLPIALSVLTGADDFAIPVAAAVVAAWVAVFVAAGAVRTVRSEY